MREPREYDFETPEILSDSPLSNPEDVAHFHFDEYAATLARLIASKSTRTPLTIGVSGAWGSGKTTLLRRLQHQLDQTQSLLKRTEPVQMDFVNPNESPQEQFRLCRTVWFNAWKYADEDALLIALVRVILQSMADDSRVNKVISKLLDPSYPRRDVVNTVLSWFSIKTPVVEVEPDTGEPQPTIFAEKTAVLDLFNEAFDRLLAVWVHRRLNVKKINPQNGVLVVFIDDLDRCLPEKTVQVLEAIKLFLDKPGCIFVLGADVEVVRQAVESHYQNASVTGQNAADYLEKVIQLRFDLPPVPDIAMQEFLQEQRVAADMLTEWRTLLAAAQVNPRRVKAVLNDIELQWRMLVNSGQALGVQRADFIRWSALMRAASNNFRSRVYDIDDIELRYKFIQDALRWAGGDREETLVRTFQDYEKEARLRRVLREIQKFSDGFDPPTLDAFIHLAAPPMRVSVSTAEGVKAGERVVVTPETAEAYASVSPPVVTVREAGREIPGVTVRTWGGIDFVRVPAGKFLMGSKEDDPQAYENEKPQHTVEISHEYWIGRYPVTNAQFTAFVQASGYRTAAEKEGSGYTFDGKEWKHTPGADWRHPRGPQSSLEGKDDHPVVLVSWDDAREFVLWLNRTCSPELPAGQQFRLPTEAEWEKAARGEYGNEYPWGDEPPDSSRCNFGMNVGDTTPVGKYSPLGDSPYGCADMAGNVWEWCLDWYDENEYRRRAGAAVVDPRGPESGTQRVRRGGSFGSNRRYARCADRDRLNPDYRSGGSGFRVVVSP